MDYQKASSIRKKSLLQLIAENKFKEGKGIGSSIGGAISSKFKAKSMGVKEALDPLNWVRKLTGKGIIGDIATTMAGRAFGRSDKDISYFGGYKRKKKRGNKDPQFTSIGPGIVQDIRIGDSVADILGKTYNFMKLSYERDKLNDEIQAAFVKEQKVEDEKRHEKLIEAILQKKLAPKGDEDEVNKTLGAFKTMLAPLFSWAKKFAAWASILAGGDFIKGIVKSVVAFIAESEIILKLLADALWKLLLKPFRNLILAIVPPLIAAHEYEKIRTDESRSTEAGRAASNLSKGPAIKKGEITDGMAGNIKPEVMEDYSKGKLGLYDNVPIPDTGGKSAPMLLSDNETKDMMDNFKVLQKNYDLLWRYKWGEVDPKTVDLDKIKQDIADSKLNIAKIQKEGLNRLKLSGARDDWWQIPFFKEYSGRQADEDINNLIDTYSKSDAKNQIDKTITQRYMDDISSLIDKQIKNIDIPVPPSFDFNEPNISVNNQVSTLGGKSSAVDTTPIDPRNSNESMRNSQIAATPRI